MRAERLQVCQPQLTLRPVGAGQNAAVWSHPDGRTTAGWSDKLCQPQDPGQDRLSGGDQTCGAGQALEAIPELLVGQSELVGLRGLIDIDPQVGSKTRRHGGERGEFVIVAAHHHGGDVTGTPRHTQRSLATMTACQFPAL